ncbi:MAG TPA: YciI family protein [Chitinophagaceae bacterium]|nr:YciI family protein [Chitinophagaceae bacterium]
MAEFMLLFRRDTTAAVPSAEEMQEIGKQWWHWRSQLEAQNKVVATGNRLSQAGRVVKSKDVVTDGPYAEIKEVLAGYMILRAEDFEEAVSIARDCPIILTGGNVEIRKFIAPDDNVS